MDEAQDPDVLPKGPTKGPRLCLARSTEDEENVNVVALTYPIELLVWDEVLEKPMPQLAITVTLGENGPKQSIRTDDKGKVRFRGGLISLTHVAVEDSHTVVRSPLPLEPETKAK